jgi:hypothetical protein
LVKLLPDYPDIKVEFIQHYYATYSRPALPPSWMVFELLSFGTVSLVYKNRTGRRLPRAFSCRPTSSFPGCMP